jgi:nucleoside-diphosphate-sugar epimerase
VSTVAVTGAAGSVGRRVIRLLAADPAVKAVKAFDRITFPTIDPRVESHQVDVASAAMVELLDGCDSLIHLAEDPGRRTDAALALSILNRVLDATEQAGCGHVVLLSSALVYGAHPDNPVPLTEAHPRRPVTALAYATAKAQMEQAAERWAASSGAELAELRPTTTLSERGVSYIAGALRAATSLRPEQLDPPVQFLHHDDLASAAALVAARRLSGIYNVAPDGWIGSERFRTLQGEAELRWPEPINDIRVKVARLIRPRALEPGLDQYVAHPWVVANDRLRSAGWVPGITNEEAYVLGNPPPLWRSFTLRRRQELALGLAGTATVGAIAAAGLLGRRFLRR